MKKTIFILLLIANNITAQNNLTLNIETAEQLANMPLGCIRQEYPNKTGHTIISREDNMLLPNELHPSFYGCYDWHSSVHGHWLLVHLLTEFPNLPNAQAIEETLSYSFRADRLQAEANYFDKYRNSKTFERTYGWAWLLKLDEALYLSSHPKAAEWRKHLTPLTNKIVSLWKEYLPKQTYPNRTGVHQNTAFALGFAIDWARTTHNSDFEQQLIAKALGFFAKEKKTPAYLEPNPSDFFSPSLEIAELMSRILPQKEFVKWFKNFYDPKSLHNILQTPVVSDLNDYQTVHLVGLSFSRAWCMKRIAKHLPDNHKYQQLFEEQANNFINNAFPLMFDSNYGGSHWLATFALYALMP